jgi:hypothetical protein
MMSWLFPTEKVGTLTDIALTWGGKGNQVCTIDGVKYATWMDYKEFPPIGAVVTHRPYREFGMLCTRIDKNEALNLNPNSTQ